MKFFCVRHWSYPIKWEALVDMNVKKTSGDSPCFEKYRHVQRWRGSVQISRLFNQIFIMAQRAQRESRDLVSVEEHIWRHVLCVSVSDGSGPYSVSK